MPDSLADALAIQRIADRLAPELRREFLAAVEQLRGRISLAAIAQAVERGTTTITVAGFEQDLQAAARVVSQVFMAAGGAAAVQLGRRLGIGMRFDVVNPLAVAAAQRNAAALVTGVTANTQAAIRAVIVRAFTEGIPPREAATLIKPLIGLTESQAMAVITHRFRLLELGLRPDKVQAAAARYAARLLKQRATMLARSEIIRASTDGTLALWDQAQRDGLLSPKATKTWLITEDAKVCKRCLAIKPKTVALGASFTSGIQGVQGPPLHPMCLPADALVLPIGRIAAVSKRPFEGDVLVIRTASDQRLTCTPNHPILTNRGWVPARLLNEVGHVITHRLIERVLRRDQDGQDVPTRIHEIAEAFRRSRKMVAMEVPVAAPDFHGDGMGSEVAVIRSNGLLGNDLDSVTCEECGHSTFERRNVRPKTFAGLRVQSFSLNRAQLSARRVVRSLDLLGAFIASHLLPLQVLSFAGASYFDATAFQAVLDDAPRTSMCLRQFVHGNTREIAGDEFFDRQVDARASGSAAPVIDRHVTAPQSREHDVQTDATLAGEILRGAAGAVFTDQIVDIHRQHFQGHVYNLTTESGAYIADGIVNHNCRCALGIGRP